MPSDPVRHWRRRRLRGRLFWLAASLITGATLLCFRHALPPTEVRGVPVDLGPSKGPIHRLFGTPSAPSEASPGATADTAQMDLETDLLGPLDFLREHGAWCGDPAPEVSASGALSEAAIRQATWLARTGVRKHHTPGSPHGPTPKVRASKTGYTGAVGEVIAWGQRRGQTVMDGWEASPDHCHVVLDSNWTDVGCAYRDPVWVMLFGHTEPE